MYSNFVYFLLYTLLKKVEKFDSVESVMSRFIAFSFYYSSVIENR